MKTLLLALAALLFTLLLPALITHSDGTPYLALKDQNLLLPSTYTSPYDQFIKSIATPLDLPHEETVRVYRWEDYRSMHFSDRFDQSVARKVRPYLVRDTFTGRFVIPRSWVWTTILAVWLLFYGSGSFLIWGFARLIKGSTTQDKPNDPVHDTHTILPPSPHKILGVDEQAGAEEITQAYRKRIMEYHPDRVAHLGIELQEVAKRKTLELNHAYEMLQAFA